MDPLALDGSDRRVGLTRGYALRAPGLRGTVELLDAFTGATRARGDGPTSAELDAALSGAGMREAATIALAARSTALPPTAAGLRAPGGEAALELEVSDLGPDRAQVVLMRGEDGALTWHFPLADDGRVQPPTTRGAGGVKRFRIPSAPPARPAGAAEERGVIGAVGRRLLKVLVYPVTDPVLGPIGELFARRWEERHRPYRVRAFTPADYTAADAAELTDGQWAELGKGPALLFVHGTFSTAHGAFGGLPRELMTALVSRYQGRVFAFDSHTLSEDPDENARILLARVPEGVSLTLDVVAHSRGGLVTRQIALRGTEAGSRVTVRRAVMVGVPNAGTILADPDHMVHMIDRFTNAVSLLPSGPATEILEGVLTVVKVLGHAAATGLPGLAAMRPGGAFLDRLNGAAGGDTEYFGIAADFQPKADALGALIRQRVADAVLDRVFQRTANDLVVPTTGVYEVDVPGGLRIPAQRLLKFDPGAGVTHTTYFGAPETARALDRWLQA